VLLVLKEPPVTMELLELLDPMAFLDQKVPLEIKALKDLLDNPVPMVLQVNRALKDHPDHKDLKDLKDLKDQQAFQEILVQQAHQDLKANPAKLAPQERMDPLVHKVQMVFPVNPALKAHKVQLVRQAHKVQLVHLVLKVQTALLVNLVLKVVPVLKVLPVLKALLVPRVFKVTKAKSVLLVPVFSVHLLLELKLPKGLPQLLRVLLPTLPLEAAFTAVLAIGSNLQVPSWLPMV